MFNLIATHKHIKLFITIIQTFSISCKFYNNPAYSNTCTCILNIPPLFLPKHLKNMFLNIKRNTRTFSTIYWLGKKPKSKPSKIIEFFSVTNCSSFAYMYFKCTNHYQNKTYIICLLIDKIFKMLQCFE